MRAPLPGVDASHDLWLAAQFADGNWGALLECWRQPLQALLLTPAIALGAPAFAAAQVLACLCGGLAIVPTAMAAERLLKGAGVPAAVLAMAFAGTTLAAGAGAETPLRTLLLATALWAFVSKRWATALVLFGFAAANGIDRVAASYESSLDELRIGVGAAVLLLPGMLLQRCSGATWILYAAFLLAVAVGRFCDSLASLPPIYSPLLAVVAGVTIAPVPVRLRDLMLCALVLVEGHAAWTLGEARSAVVERVLPQYLMRRLNEPGELVASSMPRVRWAAGRNPKPKTSLAGQKQDYKIGSVVLSPREKMQPILRASFHREFEQAELPYDLQELVDAHDLLVLQRRRK